MKNRFPTVRSGCWALISLAALAIAATATAETRTTRERVVDRLLDSSGLEGVIENRADDVVEGLVRSGTYFPAYQMPVLRRIAQKHFGESVLRAAIEARFDQRLTVAHARAVLDWWKSPTGRKVMALERSARSAGRFASVREANASSSAGTRRQLFEKLQNALRMNEFAADLTFEPPIATFIGAATARGEATPTAIGKFRAERDAERAEAIREIRRTNLAWQSKILAPMSYEELNEYLAFVESPSGQWYRDAVQDSLLGTLVDASRAFGEEFGAYRVREKAAPAKARAHGDR